MTKLMSLKELIEYTGVSERTIRALLQEGVIPAGRIGRQWRFNRERIDEWMEKQGNKGRIRRHNVNQYI